MVDAADLKSASCKGVWVRVPPSAVNQPVEIQESKAKNFISMTNNKAQMSNKAQNPNDKKSVAPRFHRGDYKNPERDRGLYKIMDKTINC